MAFTTFDDQRQLGGCGVGVNHFQPSVDEPSMAARLTCLGIADVISMRPKRDRAARIEVRTSDA
ncbi:hypothetical protein [Actinacidiphila glaucinigra]|uniref:hypothetical protein n=1 Tax=Actinacidiphila glaucinigra TaxID=235986 RepID=UPI002E344D1C|nr:hypothetical protein [Actinacidiphila glaucinigra]